MARRVTVTKPEREAIASALESAVAAEAGVLAPLPAKHARALRGLLDKAQAATVPEERVVPGLGLKEVEAALAAGAGNRYAPWVAGNPSRLLRALHDARATEGQLRAVGEYVASWRNFHGALGLGTIVEKWGTYLAAATAAARPAPATTGPAPGHWG